jgi:hypothetical protein
MGGVGGIFARPNFNSERDKFSMRKNSSMKRGLATVAVSALAVTGLPLLMTSASAEPLSDQVAASDVVLVAPAANASIKADGANTTVH